VSLVEVELVAPAPEEGLAALDALDVLRVDAARVQDRQLRVAEVVAHRPGDPHVAEERGG
jgi:hypothetical protein